MQLRSLLWRKRRGFTLIELLLVIGIIAILAAIVIVAINPTKQLSSARDAQRRSDVNTVINAVYQYAIDKNALPSTITTGTGATAREVCKVTYMPAAATECTSLRMLSGVYLVGIPVDPTKAPTNTGYTGYKIYKDSSNRITVTAPLAEQAVISVTR